MKIKNRILGLEMIKASEIEPHPDNWRVHNEAQQNALRSSLAEIGYAAALTAYKTPEGKLRLIDGHLRAETTPDAKIPVIVLDVNEEEAKQLLLTLDPIVTMAGQDNEALAKLLEATDLPTGMEDIFAQLLASTGKIDDALGEESDIPVTFQVVANVDDEEAQQTLFEQLIKAGYECKVLTI